MSLGTILLIILIIFLLGGFSGRFGGYGYGFGHGWRRRDRIILIVLAQLVLTDGFDLTGGRHFVTTH
jgi:hypothetical protein